MIVKAFRYLEWVQSIGIKRVQMWRIKTKTTKKTGRGANQNFQYIKTKIVHVQNDSVSP